MGKRKNKTGKDKTVKGKLTREHPDWLDNLVPPEFEDDDLYRIILFFVIHSPCPGQSARGISLSDRGWKRNPWYSPQYLKNKLDKEIFGEENRYIKMVSDKETFKNECKDKDFDESFYEYRNKQRFMFVRCSQKGCNSEYMSLFYHLRNSLAHGRLAMYSAGDGDVVFVLEDGREVSVDGREASAGNFEVTSRMIVRKSSLLRVVNLLERGPQENDYTDDFVKAITEGKSKKKDIKEELEIDDEIYERYITKLKIEGVIRYEKNRWKINE